MSGFSKLYTILGRYFYKRSLKGHRINKKLIHIQGQGKYNSKLVRGSILRGLKVHICGNGLANNGSLRGCMNRSNYFW